MTLEGVQFDRSCTLCTAHKRLQAIAGSATLLTEYKPFDFAEKSDVETLLKELHKYGVCCFSSGSFPAYTAGKFAFFRFVALCIAVSSSHILDPILQRGKGPHEIFQFGSFYFLLLSSTLGNYFKYKITLGDVSFMLLVNPIKTSIECGPTSNLNLVNFVWNWFSVFDYRKDAILVFPPD
jgi:hypothetical protein